MKGLIWKKTRYTDDTPKTVRWYAVRDDVNENDTCALSLQLWPKRGYYIIDDREVNEEFFDCPKIAGPFPNRKVGQVAYLIHARDEKWWF